MNEPTPTSQSSAPAASQKRFFPWVTYSILGVTIVSFVLELVLTQIQKVDLLLLYGAKINELIVAGQVWRLVTPLFLHPSIIALGFIGYSLYSVGPTLERVFGRERFLYLYFLSGISGYVVSFYMTDLPLVGGATALFGMLAAFAAFQFRNRPFFEHPMRFVLTNLAINVALNLVLAISFQIDIWAILGGLMGGLAFAWAGGPVLAAARQPDGSFVVFDASQAKTARWVAAIQVLVLVVLVVLRMMRG